MLFVGLKEHIVYRYSETKCAIKLLLSIYSIIKYLSISIYYRNCSAKKLCCIGAMGNYGSLTVVCKLFSENYLTAALPTSN